MLGSPLLESYRRELRQERTARWARRSAIAIGVLAVLGLGYAYHRSRAEPDLSTGLQPLIPSPDELERRAAEAKLVDGGLGGDARAPPPPAPPPGGGGRGSAFLLPVVPSERHHRKHDHQHLDPGLTEAAHGSPCPLLRIRVDAHRPPAFAPPRSEHGSLRRTPRSAGTNWKESAHRTSPGAHTGRGRGVGTLSGLWGRAPSASGGDAYPWDPWGQIPQVRLSTRELRARRRGGSPPGALSGNRVLDPPLG